MGSMQRRCTAVIRARGGHSRIVIHGTDARAITWFTLCDLLF